MTVKPSYMPDDPLELPWMVMACCGTDLIDGLVENGYRVPNGWERAEPKYHRKRHDLSPNTVYE